jgi:hypothetical protein
MGYNIHVSMKNYVLLFSKGKEEAASSLLNYASTSIQFFEKRGICCVINQPQVPLRLPCFDFRTIGKGYSLHYPELSSEPNFITHSLSSRDEQLVHSRDDVHRAVLMRDYSEFLLHMDEFQSIIRTLIFFDD